MVESHLGPPPSRALYRNSRPSLTKKNSFYPFKRPEPFKKVLLLILWVSSAFVMQIPIAILGGSFVPTSEATISSNPASTDPRLYSDPILRGKEISPPRSSTGAGFSPSSTQKLESIFSITLLRHGAMKSAGQMFNRFEEHLLHFTRIK